VIVNKKDIHSWNSKYRLNFINAVSGYKGVHLIGTEGKDGKNNLAISNSIVHISSEPARIGFIIKPLTVDGDAYSHIIETNCYTLNHVHKSFLERAHATSVRVTEDQSEFDLCNLKKEYTKEFHAPFVEESNIKIGLKLMEDIKLTESDCHLIIGEVEFIDIKEDYIEEDGQLDLEKAHDIYSAGLNQYSAVKKFVNLPDAIAEDLLSFKQKKRPDNIVFDEESQSYNAKALAFGSNVGAPSIISNNLSIWKTRGILSYNHVLKSKVEKIKDEYSSLVEEYKYNELLYHAKYEFEPIIGEVYHLYQKDNKDESFLTLIPPHTWNRTHLGSFKLDSEKVWSKVDI
jgi:flavin reductase (DIM6/NTAB) family NADH-FMN oxidoreductase RutF